MKLTDVAVLMRTKSGWPLFEAMQERVVAAGASTPEHYRKHLDGGDAGIGLPRTMDSLLHYQRWVDSHPGADVPVEVARIRTDTHHAAWLSQGCPSVEDEVHYCKACGMQFTAPREHANRSG